MKAVLQKYQCVDINKKRLLSGILFIIYIVVNLLFLLHHEPWRDEAQAWLLSRDLPVWKLASHMAYEGSPCLWHLIIVPFVRVGAPYFVQNILSYVAVMAAALLLLRRSDFPFAVKAVLLCSPFLTYYYAVIAGSYCLIPLFLFLLASWFPTRKEKPVRYMAAAAFLMQTHTVMFATAFLIWLCCLAETIADRIGKKDGGNDIRRWVSAILPALSAALLFYQLLNVREGRWLQVKTADPYRTVQKMLEEYGEAVEKLFGIFPAVGFAFLIAAALFFVLLLLRRGSRAKYTVAIVTGGTCCYQLWFYAMVQGCSLQRFMTIGLVIIFGMWVMRTERPGHDKPHPGEAVFCLYSVLILLCTVSSMKEDIDKPFSNGRNAASYIRENLEQNAVFVVDAQAECSSIHPYLGRSTFLYGPNGHEYSYVTKDEHWLDRTDSAAFKEWLETYDSQGRPVYFISSMVTNYIEGDVGDGEYSLLYESEVPSIKREDFRIYKVR